MEGGQEFSIAIKVLITFACLIAIFLIAAWEKIADILSPYLVSARRRVITAVMADLRYSGNYMIRLLTALNSKLVELTKEAETRPIYMPKYPWTL